MQDLQSVFGLSDRVAVVTGAASGIGRAVARVLAKAGARVVIGDRDMTGAEETAAGIRDGGGQAVAHRVDVSRHAEVDALVGRAIDEWGRLDVMANVAGISSDGEIETLDEAEFDRVVGVNLKGTLFGCQAALRVMAEQRRGSIINISSAAIDVPVAGYGLYAMTKAAVAQLTRTLAVEAGAKGIRVNALAPGLTITPFTDRHLRNEDGSINQARYDEFIATMRSQSPLEAVGEAEDQAWLLLYLASDASRFATGQIWRANGGVAMPW
ncbi:MAG: SDR family oxidoreductase [Deltaproteobacteria bacterium]|jgi:3-oxoacyl-[acyl-carrier protein] reductase|nr:SDR family oxidoreductase [Deltaproteobacteria bacterium]